MSIYIYTTSKGGVILKQVIQPAMDMGAFKIREASKFGLFRLDPDQIPGFMAQYPMGSVTKDFEITNEVVPNVKGNSLFVAKYIGTTGKAMHVSKTQDENMQYQAAVHLHQVQHQPQPQAGKQMTARAEFTYEQYVASGWTDADLINHGLMMPPVAPPPPPRVAPAPPVAPPPPPRQATQAQQAPQAQAGMHDIDELRKLWGQVQPLAAEDGESPF